jgi:selenocysteine lyase/cysteine desulfurase
MIVSNALWPAFIQSISHSEPVAHLRAGLVGADREVHGPFGARPVIYADYTGSGRALWQIERFMLEHVLPFYANSHSQASFCGSFTTTLREQARQVVADHCNADNDYATIFAGAGATAGLSRLPHLLGVNAAVADGVRPIVLVGPYEHHSNILPWRESGADVVEIAEGDQGGPDLDALEAALSAAGPERLKIGAFSAVSNVTGIVTDVDAVSRVLNRYGARVVWDYASGGPYLTIDMRSGTPWQKDVVAFSPHKFIGGPGASGVLIVRKDVVRTRTPTIPGGGTVSFVSSSRHDYLDRLEEREEGGTPNILGDIRAALCILVKESIGQDFLDRRHAQLRARAVSRWRRNPDIALLGNQNAERLVPTFAFRIRDSRTGQFVHQLLVTRLLSDVYGIQARGGCSCAGPYGHALLAIGPDESLSLRTRIFEEGELAKPGWSRLNLSALLDDDKADLIIDAVDQLPDCASRLADRYAYDAKMGGFNPVAHHVCA